MANDLSSLTRDQLAKFLNNDSRAIKAFEQLLQLSQFTFPDQIAEIEAAVQELLIAVGLSSSQGIEALDLIRKIESSLAVIAAAPNAIQTTPNDDPYLVPLVNQIISSDDIYLAPAIIPPTQDAELALLTLAPVPNVVYIDQPYLEDANGGTSLASGTVKPIASITLTPGDWEVYGYCAIDTAALTTMTQAVAGSHTTNSGYGASGSYWQFQGPTLTGAILSFAIPTIRYEVTVNTVIYLNALATFATSTAQAYGKISARKIFKGAV